MNGATTKCTGKKKTIRQTYNVCTYSTTNYCIFNTATTLVILTNYTDLTSVGVSNSCGYRGSHGIVTAGCNIYIYMIRLLHIWPSYIPCVAVRDSKFYLPALLDLQVQVSYHGCGLWLRTEQHMRLFLWKCLIR